MLDMQYGAVFVNVEDGCVLMKLFSFFVLKATLREAYSREGQESQLKEENSGQTYGEVSSNESFSTVKFHAQILVKIWRCPWEWRFQHLIC